MNDQLKKLIGTSVLPKDRKPTEAHLPPEEVQVDDKGEPIYKRCPNCGGYHG